MDSVFSDDSYPFTSPAYKAAQKAFDKAFMKGETWNATQITNFCREYDIELYDFSEIMHNILYLSRYSTGSGVNTAVIHALKVALVTLQYMHGEEEYLSNVMAASPRVDRHFHVFETHDVRLDINLGEGIKEVKVRLEEFADKIRKAGAFNYTIVFTIAKINKGTLDAYADALLSIVGDIEDESPLYKVVWAAMQETVKNMMHEVSSVQDKLDYVQDLIMLALSILVSR